MKLAYYYSGIFSLLLLAAAIASAAPVRPAYMVILSPVLLVYALDLALCAMRSRWQRLPMEFRSELLNLLVNLLALPFRLLWNATLFLVIVSLQIGWLGLLLGSTLGLILVLIFAPGLLLLPLALWFYMKDLWPAWRYGGGSVFHALGPKPDEG